MNEYITASADPRETIDVLKRMLSDSDYYKMYAQLNVATYYKTLNLDAAALRVLIAHYELQRISVTPQPWEIPSPEELNAPLPDLKKTDNEA